MKSLKLAIFRDGKRWKVIDPEGHVMYFHNMVSAMAEAYALSDGTSVDLETALGSL